MGMREAAEGRDRHVGDSHHALTAQRCWTTAKALDAGCDDFDTKPINFSGSGKDEPAALPLWKRVRPCQANATLLCRDDAMKGKRWRAGCAQRYKVLTATAAALRSGDP